MHRGQYESSLFRDILSSIGIFSKFQSIHVIAWSLELGFQSRNDLILLLHFKHCNSLAILLKLEVPFKNFNRTKVIGEVLGTSTKFGNLPYFVGPTKTSTPVWR